MSPSADTRSSFQSPAHGRNPCRPGPPTDYVRFASAVEELTGARVVAMPLSLGPAIRAARHFAACRRTGVTGSAAERVADQRCEKEPVVRARRGRIRRRRLTGLSPPPRPTVRGVSRCPASLSEAHWGTYENLCLTLVWRSPQRSSAVGPVICAECVATRSATYGQSENNAWEGATMSKRWTICLILGHCYDRVLYNPTPMAASSAAADGVDTKTTAEAH